MDQIPILWVPGTLICLMRHLASLSNSPELSTGSNTASHLLALTPSLATFYYFTHVSVELGWQSPDYWMMLWRVWGGQSWSLEAGLWGSDVCAQPPVNTDLHQERHTAMAHRTIMYQLDSCTGKILKKCESPGWATTKRLETSQTFVPSIKIISRQTEHGNKRKWIGNQSTL